ncbi:WXG100 family type VII secretion target [Actinoplanes sp. TFC3]|uniref:WXG100 family type VII secretion target n=1 Tax=Actinoplanes sp. TFC3 TaxID=1710355 RepID=UPI0008377011|nr:hypothetical protein [Actinoplanes sp. TFC3]
MTPLDRLASLQDAIHAGTGNWPLAAREAARVASIGGDAAQVLSLEQGWRDAAAALHESAQVLAALVHEDFAGAWAGEAHTAAAEVVRALADEVARAAEAVRGVAGVLGTYGEGLESATVRDRTGRIEMQVAPEIGIDLRVAAHIAARDNASDLAVELHDLAGQAARLPLGALDCVLINDSLPLAPATVSRVELVASGTRELIMSADSAPQRAYLLKASAAGYEGADLVAFAEAIAPHDAGWLDQHLDPLAWGQGPYPTCVAAATVTAHAEVDPVYALSITSTPGELRSEQQRVYDGGRNWVQDVLGLDGMTPGQSAQVANEEIAPHTGRRYEERPFGPALLADIERAVDDGYPIPFIAADHELVVIGHTGDQLRIYNPWGSTYWISEQEFADASPLVGFPS